MEFAPRLCLVGYSFGAKLVTSVALGGARPASVTLLLDAFSAFAFAPGSRDSIQRGGEARRISGRSRRG